MTQAPPPPGWYPDQRNPAIERWWQGEGWTEATRPAAGSAPAAASARGFAHWGLIGLLIAVVGLAIVLFTNVTVLNGMNQVVFGAILAVAGAVLALFTRPAIALRITCIALAIFAVVGAVYDQHQVDQKRKEIQQIFNSP